MRIAHLVDGGPHPDVANGVRKYVYFIARAQAEQALAVAVFGLTDEPATEIPNVLVRSFPRSRVPFRVGRTLLDALEHWRPDVLHLHSPYYPPHVTLARWARAHGVPYVVTPNGALSPGEISQRWLLKLPYKYLFELPTLNRAAFVHAVGATERLCEYGVRTPVELVPCGIDPASVPADTDRDALVRRHPVLRGRRVFVFLGRLDPAQKGLDLLVRAFAAARLDDAALVLIGPDFRGGRRRLERLLAHERPAAPVVLADAAYGREKFDLLAGAHVFVHTPRWEGMPNAVLEAAALGLPLLLTPPADPLGRLAEIGAAVPVEPAVPSIVEGLRSMARLAPEELGRMGARARDLVRAEFPWSRSAEGLAAAYAKHGTRRAP